MKKVVHSTLFTLILLFFCGCLSVMAEGRLPLRVQMVIVKVNPLLEKGQYEQAVAILSKFQNKKNGPEDTIHDHAEINFVLGYCHTLLGQQKKARSYYTHAVTRDPEHLSGWQNLAKTEYELENYSAASKAFFKSYELTDKSEAELLYYSGLTLLMAEQYQACLELFDSLLAAHPEEVTLQWKENLVYALLHADRPKKALGYIIELAQKFTGDKQQQWQEILLQQYMALGMRKEAMAVVQTLTRNSPTIAIWWKALAHIELQYEHYDKALAALTIYSYLSPVTTEEEKLLGDLYMQQGIPQKAVVNYENCANKKVDQQTLVSLVRSYLNLDRPELALDRLKTFGAALEAQKREMLQGEIHYLMKDYSQAAEFYERAAKSKGKRGARAFLMAGYSYWQQGRLKSAQHCFHEAAKSMQFKKVAEKAIKQLINASQN